MPPPSSGARPRATLERLGGIATAADLEAHGVPGSTLRAAVGPGLLRVRKGVYALPTCHPDVIRAARLGGRLAGRSAAHHLGLWSPPRSGLVIEVPRGAPTPSDPDVMVIGGTHRARRVGVSDLPDVVRQVLRTEPLPYAVAVLDSVMRRTPLSRVDLEFICRDLPVGRRRVLQLLDERAESGTESVLRVALTTAGIPVRTQVPIPLTDLHRLDLLVGDRLVIECDSREFHSTPQQLDRDNERDLTLIALGFLVLRVRYRAVMFHLDDVVLAIRRMVDDGVHRGGTASIPDDTPHVTSRVRRVAQN